MGCGWKVLLALAITAAVMFREERAVAGPVPRPPNIILIIADDLGYGDLGCYGGAEIATPHIDSLARQGIRFTDAYVSAPSCSPARAGLLTGRYQQRFGHETNPTSPQNEDPAFGLPVSERTLAEELKSAGYATGLVGKWHLGWADQFHPLRRGFDEFFGFLGGKHEYLGPHREGIYRGTRKVSEREYLTDAFTREAVAFIDRYHHRPFFLCLSYSAVHAPLQAPGKYRNRFPEIAQKKRRTLAGMLAALDDGVGAIVAKLRESDLESETLIFFISDNGAPTRDNASLNHPFRGEKNQLLEGGIRIPFIIQWKDRLPAGKTVSEPVMSLDVFSTALAAAGVVLPPDRAIDGVNLIPFLQGQSTQPPHETLFWRFGEARAIRKGKWKLLMRGRGRSQLFDLASDPGEEMDMLNQHEAVANELAALLRHWEGELKEPLWAPPRLPRYLLEQEEVPSP